MPALTHYVFVHPSNAETKLWRYMDFTKYVSMLEHQGLFLCRSDLIGDPFEGSIPKKSKEAFETVVKESLQNAPNARPDATIQGISNFRKALRQDIYLNCWHANECESAAMWNLYSRTGNAIAI